MGFFDSIISAASAVTKVALSPVGLVADIGIKVVTNENSNIAENLVKSAGRDISDSIDNLID